MGEGENSDEWVKLLRSLPLPLFFICIPLLMLLSSPHRYDDFLFAMCVTLWGWDA